MSSTEGENKDSAQIHDAESESVYSESCSASELSSESVPSQVKEAIKDPEAEKTLRKTAKKAITDARKLYKRAEKSLSEDVRKEVLEAIDSLDKGLSDNEHTCSNDLNKLNQIVNKRLKFAKKSGTREVFESLLIAMLVALFIRTFFVEPFKIPTRSMVPTLLEGDQLFVTKLSYGIRLPFIDKYVVRFSEPQHGDVVVFKFPREDAARYLAVTNSGCLAASSLAEQKDYIKRIIAVAGDKVEVIDQVVYVNGEPIAQQSIYERTVQNYMYMADKRRENWNREQHGEHSYMTITHELPNNHFGPITVEPDHIFVMGDNRDNSADSRCWGQVPFDNIKGRAQIIWWSGGSQGPRTERMFTGID